MNPVVVSCVIHVKSMFAMKMFESMSHPVFSQYNIFVSSGEIEKLPIVFVGYRPFVRFVP